MSERIGKYRVLAKIGEGGMARVLLTVSGGMAGFHKLLVVKELRAELVHDHDFLTMFLEEARIAARLNHPNIVQTYEVGNDGDRYYMAMEYLEGQPLSAVFRRLGRTNFSLEMQLRVLVEVLRGLEHAHQLADFDGAPLGVVHRDVSPQNVFVTYAGQVKLVDFGIAKVAGASSTTRQGTMKGKLSYIAPEQCRCEPVDARADLFSVGVMLWESIARRRLVQREDEKSILARRMSGDDPRVITVMPDAPADLCAICDRAMAPDPENRYPSAAELREDLEAWLVAHGNTRVGASQIAKVVSDAFAEERATIRGIIEQQVNTIGQVEEQEPISLDLHPAMLLQTHEGLPRVTPRLLPEGSEPPFSAHLTQLNHQVNNGPRTAAVAPLLAGVGAFLAVVLVVGWFVLRPPAALPAPTGSETTAAPAPAMVRVSVRYPQGARLLLDGGEVSGNPFKLEVPRDGSLHRLVVEQDGFASETRTLPFDRDVDLDVQLVAGAASSKVQSTGPRPRPYPQGRPQPGATLSPKPGDEDEPKKRPPPSFDIDEDNPYKKK
ncbi:MAG: serine/threonine-protein kinase [Polyangiaceae bacterium]